MLCFKYIRFLKYFDDNDELTLMGPVLVQSKDKVYVDDPDYYYFELKKPIFISERDLYE